MRLAHESQDIPLESLYGIVGGQSPRLAFRPIGSGRPITITHGHRRIHNQDWGRALFPAGREDACPLSMNQLKKPFALCAWEMCSQGVDAGRPKRPPHFASPGKTKTLLREPPPAGVCASSPLAMAWSSCLLGAHRGQGQLHILPSPHFAGDQALNAEEGPQLHRLPKPTGSLLTKN
ncbi:hypothetical protein Celaphus_00012096, partial [Cervus elaphus hippelaphus]